MKGTYKMESYKMELVGEGITQLRGSAATEKDGDAFVLATWRQDIRKANRQTQHFTASKALCLCNL